MSWWFRFLNPKRERWPPSMTDHGMAWAGSHLRFTAGDIPMEPRLRDRMGRQHNLTSRLPVVQINLHHSKGASAILQRSMAGMHTGIALIQEPWIAAGAIRGLGNLLCFRDPKAERPRACIAVKGLNVVPLLDLCTGDLMAVSTTLDGIGEVIIASAYFPHDNVENPPKETCRIVEYCQKNNKLLLLGCDANSHHMMWGSTDTNQRGDNLMDYLVTTNLDILNVGNTPTFRNAVRAEVLDITLCTSTMTDKVFNWRVLDEPSLSDHAQIAFDLGTPATQRPIWIRNPRNTNWAEYSRELEESLKEFPHTIKDEEALERAANCLSEGITKSFNKHCPPKQGRPKGQVSWWDQKLENLRNRTRITLKEARKGNSASLWHTYNSLRDEYRKAIREAQRKSWATFCENINKGAEAARLDKILSKNPEAILGTLKLPNGEYARSDNETLIHLIETHFPGFHKLGGRDDPPASQDIGSGCRLKASRLGGNRLMANLIVSPAKIRWALGSFRPYKSPGPDGIYPALLQRAEEVIIGPLTRLASASLTLGKVPTAWRGTRAVFIPKPGRCGYTSPKDFRPISLTSFLLKTVERVIDRYIRDTVLTVKPLHRDQHAYRAGFSTETALHRVVNLVKGQLEGKGFAIGTLMDIEGAFNHTSREVIKSALSNHGVPLVIAEWVVHMLGNRVLVATKGDTTIQGTVDSGCPQGGVLSPLLWCLVVDELLEELTKLGCHPIGYADDIMIIVRGPFLSPAMDIMQTALMKVDSWCRASGLSVNPSKTEVLVFTRRYKWSKNCTLTLNGQTLTRKENVKYLGVILDGKLSWKKHLEHVCRKLTASLWQMRRAIGRSWGLKPETMKWIFEAVLKPRLTYASLVWWDRTSKITSVKTLEKVRGIILRSITGASRSTPIGALGVLTGIEPFKLTLMASATKALYRIRNCVAEQGGGITARLPMRLDGEAIWDMCPDRTTISFIIDKKYRISLSNKSDWESGKINLPSNGDIWYTDGSKNSDGAGAGVYRRRTGIGTIVPLGKYATALQTEITAICHCAIKAHETTSSEHMYICSDSQSAIKALDNYTTRSRLVRGCHEALNNLAEKRRVTLLWVPGHSGIRGNVIADNLAKLGARESLIGPEPAVGICDKLVCQKIEGWITMEHRKTWENIDGCRQAKAFLRPTTMNDWPPVILKLNRTKMKTITGIITGHGGLRYHRHKTGLSTSPLCRFCNKENETTTHILEHCKPLEERRNLILGSPSLRTTDIEAKDVHGLLLFWEKVFGMT